MGNQCAQCGCNDDAEIKTQQQVEISTGKQLSSAKNSQ